VNTINKTGSVEWLSVITRVERRERGRERESMFSQGREGIIEEKQEKGGFIAGIF
jgi:hypothetical protein